MCNRHGESRTLVTHSRCVLCTLEVAHLSPTSDAASRPKRIRSGQFKPIISRFKRIAVRPLHQQQRQYGMDADTGADLRWPISYRRASTTSTGSACDRMSPAAMETLHDVNGDLDSNALRCHNGPYSPAKCQCHLALLAATTSTGTAARG